MSDMSDMDAEGIPDLETPVNQDEGLIPPRDHPQAVDEFGTTAAEARADEALADRVLREEPDVDERPIGASDDDALHGRLIEPGSEDVDGIDEEKDAVATAATDGEDGLSAEESAMHITDSP